MDGNAEGARQVLSSAKTDPGRGAPRIFISHKVEADGLLARRLGEYLEARGHRCWIAPRDVPPGTDYADVIVRALTSMEVLLVVVSRASMESQHVRREVEHALKHPKMLFLPIRIDRADLTDRFQYILGSVQYVDAVELGEDRMLETVARAVSERCGDAATPGAARAPSPGEKRRANGSRLGMVAAAVLLFTGLVWSLQSSFPWSEPQQSAAGTAPPGLRDDVDRPVSAIDQDARGSPTVPDEPGSGAGAAPAASLDPEQEDSQGREDASFAGELQYAPSFATIIPDKPAGSAPRCRVHVELRDDPLGAFDADSEAFRTWVFERALPRTTPPLELAPTAESSDWIIQFSFETATRGIPTKLTVSGDFFVTVLLKGAQVPCLQHERLLLDIVPSAVGRHADVARGEAFRKGLRAIRHEDLAGAQLRRMLEAAVQP